MNFKCFNGIMCHEYVVYHCFCFLCLVFVFFFSLFLLSSPCVNGKTWIIFLTLRLSSVVFCFGVRVISISPLCIKHSIIVLQISNFALFVWSAHGQCRCVGLSMDGKLDGKSTLISWKWIGTKCVCACACVYCGKAWTCETVSTSIDGLWQNDWPNIRWKSYIGQIYINCSYHVCLIAYIRIPFCSERNCNVQQSLNSIRLCLWCVLRACVSVCLCMRVPFECVRRLFGECADNFSRLLSTLRIVWMFLAWGRRILLIFCVCAREQDGICNSICVCGSYTVHLICFSMFVWKKKYPCYRVSVCKKKWVKKASVRVCMWTRICTYWLV